MISHKIKLEFNLVTVGFLSAVTGRVHKTKEKRFQAEKAVREIKLNELLKKYE